jgi:ribokinase
MTDVPGGKAGNAAVAAARLLGKGRVAIFGALGNDTVANDHVRIFNEEGVVSSGLKFCPGLRSGQAYIAVDESGENVIYSYSGANSMLTPEDLDDPERRMLLSEAPVVALMNPPLETAVRLAAEAKKIGKRVAYDPAVRSEIGLDALQPVLSNVNYLFANESEMRNLTALTNPEDAVRTLMAKYPFLKVIQKLGERGSIMYDGGSKVFIGALNLKLLGMEILNTVGCGDSFFGAFVAALVEGLPDLEALRWGTCAAGLKATKRETRGSPDRETLLKYLDYVKFSGSFS